MVYHTWFDSKNIIKFSDNVNNFLQIFVFLFNII